MLSLVNDSRKGISMDKNIPLPGTFYKNLDGNIFQIICIARNCKDKEKEVVYQKMFPPFDIWIESLKNFIEKNTEVYSDTVDNKIIKKEHISDSAFRDALLNGTIDRKIAGQIPDSEIAQKGFMEFLDANNYHDKYIIFSSLRNYLDRRLLNNIAVSLDIVLEDGDEEKQYESVRRCLQTLEHYETKRLR